MNDLLKSLNTLLFERVKSPLLGSFFLAYLSVNHKGIIAYYYAKDVDKVKIMNQFNFFDVDQIILALYIVCGYIVLTQFVLPLIQWLIDKLKLYTVDRPRFNQRSALKNADYEAQGNVSLLKLKSQDAYQQNLLDKEVDGWFKKKEELDNNIKDLNVQLENKNALIIDIKDNSENVISDIKERNNSEIDSLVKKHSFEVDSLVKKHSFEIDSLVKKHSFEMERLNGNEKTKVSNLDQSYQSVFYSLKNENDNYKKLLDIFHDIVKDMDSNYLDGQMHMATLREIFTAKELKILQSDNMIRLSKNNLNIINNIAEESDNNEVPLVTSISRILG